MGKRKVSLVVRCPLKGVPLYDVNNYVEITNNNNKEHYPDHSLPLLVLQQVVVVEWVANGEQ